MKKAFVAFLGVALLCCLAANADAFRNGNGKWILHNSGAHDAKNHTCAFVLDACTSINAVGPNGGARNDIYVIAIDVVEITATRYGLCCDGPFWFYGWTSCADLELPTPGWPGCSEGNAQTFGLPQAGPFVTMGILDVYVYGDSQCMSICDDPRVGFSEWCDGTEPNPICINTRDHITGPNHYGAMSFNNSGCEFNPCSIVPTEEKTWGSVKSLYR